MTTQINLRMLHAVSLAASKEETRYYLNGVLIECTPDHVTYVATDGHRLYCARETLARVKTGEYQNGVQANDVLGNWIVPMDVCRTFKPHKRGANYHQDVATLSRDGAAELRLQSVNGTQVFKPIDGSFPDWRRVMSRDMSGLIETKHNKEGSKPEAITFNPDYLVSLTKFAEMLEAGKPLIAFNGTGPAGVVFPGAEHALAVLMPMRCSTQAEIVPQWHGRFDSLVRSDMAPREAANAETEFAEAAE